MINNMSPIRVSTSRMSDFSLPPSGGAKNKIIGVVNAVTTILTRPKM